MKSSLPTELLEVERLLAELVPAEVSEDVSDRLVTAVEVTSGGLSDDESAGLGELEKHLGELSPSTMRTDVLSRMVEAMDTWYEQVPEEEKVISFDGGDSSSVNESVRSSRSGGMIAAAAAVAILGGVTALVLPRFGGEVDPGSSNGFVNDNLPSDNIRLSGSIEPRDAWMVPDAASHKVVNTSERGLVMTRDNVPHRCIQLDSMETIELEDESGRQIKIERPNVRLILIPVETN